MTLPAPVPSRRALDAAFDFARKVVDPEFREFLRGLGWESGVEQRIVTAVAEQTLGEVLRRIVVSRTEAPLLVAVPDPDAPHGFAVLMVTKVSLR